MNLIDSPNPHPLLTSSPSATATKWMLRSSYLVFVWAFALYILMNHQRLDSRSVSYGAEYGYIGYSLANGQGFSGSMGPGGGPTAWMPPVLPSLYAIVFRLFGFQTSASFYTIIVCQSGLLTVSYASMQRFVLAQLGSWAAAMTCFLFLGFGTLYREIYFCDLHDFWLVSCTVMLALTVLDSLARQRLYGIPPSPTCWLAVPFFPLCSPAVAFAFLCGLSAEVWARRKHGFGSLRPCSLALILWLVPCGLWGARNYLVLGHPYPIKSNLWFDFYLANDSDSDGIISYSTFDRFHPLSNNPNRHDYFKQGEATFVQRFQAKCRSIDRQVLARKFVNRLYNASVQTQSPVDSRVAIGLTGQDAEFLANFRWFSWHLDAPGGRLRAYWLFLSESSQCEEELLHADSPGILRILNSRYIAESRYREFQGSLSGVAFSYLIALVPSLAILFCLLRWCETPDSIRLAVRLYGCYLVPYLLVSHYQRYQMPLLFLQLYLVAWATMHLLKAIHNLPATRFR